MFICSCDTMQLSGGKRLKRGDPVPEAANWPADILRSHLRLGYLVETDKAAASYVQIDVGTRPPSAVPSNRPSVLAAPSTKKNKRR